MIAIDMLELMLKERMQHTRLRAVYKVCCCSSLGTIRYSNYSVNKLNELIKQTLNHPPLGTFIKLKVKLIDQDGTNINMSKV